MPIVGTVTAWDDNDWTVTVSLGGEETLTVPRLRHYSAPQLDDANRPVA